MLTPRLSSYWVHWMKTIRSRVSGPLIEVLRNQVVVTGDSAPELFSRIEPGDFETAIAGRLPCDGGPLAVIGARRFGFAASHRASFTPVRHTAQTHRIRGTSDKARLEMKLLEHSEPRLPGRSWSRWRRPGGILWIKVSELQGTIFQGRASDADQG